VAQVELKTNFFTPAAIAASNSFNPLPTLLRKYFPGFTIDSPTSALAAKCRMASGLVLVTASKMLSPSSGRPSMNSARSSTAERCPSERLS